MKPSLLTVNIGKSGRDDPYAEQLTCAGDRSVGKFIAAPLKGAFPSAVPVPYGADFQVVEYGEPGSDGYLSFRDCCWALVPHGTATLTSYMKLRKAAT